MSQYKDSLNLPQTTFPMKANLPQREPNILAHWKQIDLYRQQRAQAQEREKFILHDGPPYANGTIHLGHAINKILKDIIIKSKNQSGFDTPYLPGWDCHGLPIEHQVEKKYGRKNAVEQPGAFRKACADYARQQIAQQKEDFQRLGVLGDWGRAYYTMDSKIEAEIIRTFGRFVSGGYVQRRDKPVHWCLDCASALAEAEVEYKNITSPSIDVAFAACDRSAVLQAFGCTAPSDTPIEVVIWTTTPWTLPANRAVALHPTVSYQLVDGGGRLLVLAEALCKPSLSRYAIDKYTVLGSCAGSALEGKLLQHPFYDRQVPVVLGNHVTVDTGSGAVHTAPAHGLDDYRLAQSYNLVVDNPLDDRGCFRAHMELFAGLHISKANEQILAVLGEKKHLLSLRTLEHSYPHCWRHGTALIFRATPQWFINLTHGHLLKRAIDSVGQVQWLPSWNRDIMLEMLNERPDWCISRQRAWGVPIPLFSHVSDGELHPETPAIIEKVADMVEKESIQAWFDIPTSALLGDDAEHYRKHLDTLDVWFDSGVTHQSVLIKQPELSFPADLYVEGKDQHRGWFQSSLLTAVALRNTPPYRTVLTHGFAVDHEGHKMSKSRGNIITPQTVINKLGADILRLWVAATNYRNEMTVSDEIMQRVADAYKRIRNTLRFLLANIHDFDPQQHLCPLDKMLALDCWILQRSAEIQENIIADYNSYSFHSIYQKIHNFCIIDLGGFYLDIIKDRQYTMPTNSRARRSAQTALYHISEALTRWMAPILSFTAEEIWRLLPAPRAASVHLSTWYDIPTPTAQSTIDWQQIIALRNAVNKILEAHRHTNTIGANLEAEVTIYCAPEIHHQLIPLQDELHFVLICSAAYIKPLTEADDANALPTTIENVKITASPSPHAKCERCWHRRADIGRYPEHPHICERCVTNILGEGETRFYA